MSKMYVIGAGVMAALGAASAANAQSYADTVKADNPYAYFQLDNVGQGSAVNGWTANWQSGVTTGSGAPIASNPGNQAAVFNGGGGITTNVTGISGTAGTLMAWINGPAPGYDTRTIAGSSTANNNYGLLYSGSGVQGSNAQRIVFDYGSGSFSTDLLNVADSWHLVTGTFDSVTGAADIYIDGNLSTSTTNNVFNLPTRTAQFDIGITDPSYCSTAAGFCGGYPSAMIGGVDEVAVFNYALSADQVANIYASRNNVGSPVSGAVPEPASWAMMIIGFGMVGAGLRGRRKWPSIRYV